MATHPIRILSLLLVSTSACFAQVGTSTTQGQTPTKSTDSIAATLLKGAPTVTPIGQPTALEDYVNSKDGAFRWTLAKSVRQEGEPGSGSRAGWWHVLRMTSQRWQEASEISIPEWTHWVQIWVPDQMISNRPILFIGGGRRREEAPAQPASELQLLAPIGAVVVVVDNIPNQPLSLSGDSTDRFEDALCARTWIRAGETGDATWLARFPMVKGAVKAMDAADEFFASHPLKGATINGKDAGERFVPGPYLATGGSKRGWTTWLTAAIDPRVGALAPLVIDVLDIPAQMRHHWGAYGFWAPALGDYVETGFSERFGKSDQGTDPVMAAILAHEDPINWLSRVGAKPKLLINAAGDEFFLPDSSKYYEAKLPDPWFLRYVPNSGHSLKGSSVGFDLAAFYQTWALEKPMPTVTWKQDATGDGFRLSVRSTVRPTAALLWTANTAKDRDFRFDQVGKAWTSTPVEPTDASGLEFVANIKNPASGYLGSFIELTFPGAAPGLPPFTVTSRIVIAPDTLPFASK